jgi:hypothetical protein
MYGLSIGAERYLTGLVERATELVYELEVQYSEERARELATRWMLGQVSNGLHAAIATDMLHDSLRECDDGVSGAA